MMNVLDYARKRVGASDDARKILLVRPARRSQTTFPVSQLLHETGHATQPHSHQPFESSILPGTGPPFGDAAVVDGGLYDGRRFHRSWRLCALPQITGHSSSSHIKQQPAKLDKKFDGSERCGLFRWVRVPHGYLSRFSPE
jgi:hypothetical protein